MFQRQRDDAGPEANARGLRGDETEKSEGSRKAALGLMEMVLRDPCGIKPGFFSVPNLLCRQTIPLGRRRLIKKPREKPQSLQIRETLHKDLRDWNRACGSTLRGDH